MKELRDRLWEKILDIDLVYSYGIEKQGEVYNAWVNYKPPYKKNGGNWNTFGESKEIALGELFNQIRRFQNENS